MIGKLRNIGIHGKLASVLVLLVLLPAIFYSAYEFTSITRSESLIAEIYSQQLDVVLFSLNQYAWDVANSWVTTLSSTLMNQSIRPDGENSFAPFLRENGGIRYLFMIDSTLTTPGLIYANSTAHTHIITPGHITNSLSKSREVIRRLFKLESSGYRKTSSVTIVDSAGRESIALVFVAAGKTGTKVIIGIILDAERFIQEVLGQKMNEIAGDNFLLSVHRKGTARAVYGTYSPEEIRQTKELWLFPDYLVGIRLSGQTIAEVVRERFYRNLILISLLDVVLIAGAWFVFRTVRREVELAQLKADFVSNVSHELKTPLSLIRMFGESLQLKRVPSEEKKQEYYDTIVQETERLTRLVNNILNFSRMEAGKKEYQLVEANLGAIVENVLKSYELHLTHQGFAVTLRLDKSPSRIIADPESLSEALLNIIDNAVKFSDKEKFISISTGKADGMAYVEVEDHGIGIDLQNQKKIFDKFFRVSSGLVHKTKGSGLGLSLVKHIMDAHRGKVTVKSEPGKGSAFRLSFPIEFP